MKLLRSALPQLRASRVLMPNASSSSSSPPSASASSSTFNSPSAAPVLPPTPSSRHTLSKPSSWTWTQQQEQQHSTNTRTTWPKGTLDDPVPITSSTDERVVGCTGVSPYHTSSHSNHPTTWMTVRAGRPTQCPDCGQAFKLEQRSHRNYDLLN